MNDDDIGFEEDIYDRLCLDELHDWDNNDDALKEAFLRGIDYYKYDLKMRRIEDNSLDWGY